MGNTRASDSVNEQTVRLSRFLFIFCSSAKEVGPIAKNINMALPKWSKMKSIDLSYIELPELEKGYIKLNGNSNKQYTHLALNVPGYGWVPCSQKLKANFTADPKKLMLVIEEEGDEHLVTSSKWLTLSNAVRSFSIVKRDIYGNIIK
ncbi:MAG: hypothetical protein NC411_06485 [Bacteroides sp.]|nr:hypothetical protein [Bacteroides sp.]